MTTPPLLSEKIKNITSPLVYYIMEGFFILFVMNFYISILNLVKY